MATNQAKAIDLDDYRWLVSDEAIPWLARAAAANESTVGLTAALRRDLSPARTHLVLEQVELRRRAARKFPAAAGMFFTARSLEQATDHFVAEYKARRFASGAPSADLCCGIGGDLLALAARGPVTGVDRDPRMAVLAAANGRCADVGGAPPPHPRPLSREGRGRDTAELVVADVEAIDVRAFAAWHIDPDRRVGGRRSTRVELHEPGPAVIDRLRAAQPDAAVKLAPAATLPAHWESEAELEWISRGGECRQLVCWFGRLARETGRRRASIIDAHSPVVRSIVGSGGGEPPYAERLGEYLYEPDAAVLAAGLTAPLAAEHGIAAPTPSVAYLTGQRPIQDAALACFRVREVFPFDVRKLRAALATRSIGRLEIKKRSVECEPEKLRRALRPSGDRAATLIVMPLGGQTKAILAERL